MAQPSYIQKKIMFEKISVWIEYDVNSLSYDYDGGQGSGSQGTETLSGKVKSVTSDKVFISIDDAKLNKYTKKYQVMYKRDGKGISKRDITKITAKTLDELKGLSA